MDIAGIETGSILLFGETPDNIQENEMSDMLFGFTHDGFPAWNIMQYNDKLLCHFMVIGYACSGKSYGISAKCTDIYENINVSGRKLTRDNLVDFVDKHGYRLLPFITYGYDSGKSLKAKRTLNFIKVFINK